MGGAAAAARGMTQQELLELAVGIAHEAGAGLRGVFGEALAISSKSTPTDLVSEADVATEQLIRERLIFARPDDAIMGEEGDDRPGTSGLRWVVDPLDGTVNFLYGIPQWCVSIAVEDAEGGVAGVVFDAVRDETWTATRNGPPALNGDEVAAARKDDLSTALVATGFGYDAKVREIQAGVIARLLPQVRDIRRIGAAALDLCWVAAGRYDAYFERGVNHWDVAAGQLLCERAGLALRALPPAPPAGAGLLVAPPGMVDALLAALVDD